MSLPPAQPAYILRGHAAQIHSVSFMRSNTRLVTGDADGWIVVWSLATKRPVAVWRAHEGTLLGASSWGSDKLVTCVSSSALFRSSIGNSTQGAAKIVA
jgi:ASTRA-associated protein 1